MPVVNIYPENMGVLDSYFKGAVVEMRHKSLTAEAIWEYLSVSSRKFDVVVLDAFDKFGQMLTEHDRTSPEAIRARGHYAEVRGSKKIERPTVLWSPDYTFEYFGDVNGAQVNRLDGSMRLIPEEVPFAKSKAYVLQAENVPSQRVEPKQSSSMAERIRRMERREGTVEFNPIQKRPSIRMLQLTRCTMPAELVLFHELGHVKQYYEGGGETAWSGRISDASGIALVEAENLLKHENPMSRDCGSPIRAHYKHSVKGFESILDSYRQGSGWKLKALRVSKTPTQRENDDVSLASLANGQGAIDAEKLKVTTA